MLAWVLGGLVVLAVIAALALQFAISRNGPAVLSAVDRITGGERGAVLRATISTGENEQQKLLVWGDENRNLSTPARPVLIFAHGGSWRTGDPVDYSFIARAFVPEGFVVVLVGYRLEEAGKYPAMIEDTARAIGWTHREIGQYGGDPERIVLAGHSAGAYNVVMTALEERWLAGENVPPDAIKGVIGLSGPYDFAPFKSDSTIAAFGHVEEPEITQPIAHVRDSAPQMLLVHGEDDTLVYPRNTRLLAERLKAAGGHALPAIIEGMEHNDPLISLAAPWRSRREIIALTAGFAAATAGAATTDPATNRATTGDKTSVPVKPQTR